MTRSEEAKKYLLGMLVKDLGNDDDLFPEHIAADTEECAQEYKVLDDARHELIAEFDRRRGA